MVWEPREHIGAGLVNAHGALSWNELASPDPEASASFYGRLFGWSAEPMAGVDPPYLVIKTAATARPTAASAGAASTEPCYWLVYFGTDDLEGSLAKVEELGGATARGSDCHRARALRCRSGPAGRGVRALQRRVRSVAPSRGRVASRAQWLGILQACAESPVCASLAWSGRGAGLRPTWPASRRPARRARRARRAPRPGRPYRCLKLIPRRLSLSLAPARRRWPSPPRRRPA